MPMSAEKQNDSVTHTHIQSCKNTLFHYGLSQEIGFSSLCYTVGPCLTILNVIVCFYLSACVLSHVPLFATPWAVTCQDPLSMGFSRQEYWRGLSFSPPEDLPNPEMEPRSLVSSAMAGRFFTTAPPGKPTPNSWSTSSPPPLPLGNHDVCSPSLSLFLIYTQVHLCHILDSTYK